MLAHPAHQPTCMPPRDVLWRWPFTPDDWVATPQSVRDFCLLQTREGDRLREENRRLKATVETLSARVNQNSQNSNRPPSSDSPAQKARRKDREKSASTETLNADTPASPAKKRGAREGHPGHGPVLLEPTNAPIDLRPLACTRCGGDHLCDFALYDTRQWIEIRIERDVEHARCFQATCQDCGAAVRPDLPQKFQTGFGPRATTMAVALTGLFPAPRRPLRDFFRQVLGIPIELGTVQKLIDRGSKAIEPIYDATAEIARKAPVNHIDETSQFLFHELAWLWVMANHAVAYYKVLSSRSADAFRTLIGDWSGTLVADDYVVYRDWPHGKQSCIPHLMRHATAVEENADPSIAAFGQRIKQELSRLSEMAHAPPTVGQFQAWLMRISRLLQDHADRKDDAGKLARAIMRQKRQLWTFLVVPGVEHTNNRAERAVRFGVIWRKRSLSIQSEKGCRWVERILTVRETCRLQGANLFDVLLDAVTAHLEGRAPD